MRVIFTGGTPVPLNKIWKKHYRIDIINLAPKKAKSRNHPSPNAPLLIESAKFPARIATIVAVVRIVACGVRPYRRTKDP